MTNADFEASINVEIARLIREGEIAAAREEMGMAWEAWKDAERERDDAAMDCQVAEEAFKDAQAELTRLTQARREGDKP